MWIRKAKTVSCHGNDLCIENCGLSCLVSFGIKVLVARTKEGKTIHLRNALCAMSAFRSPQSLISIDEHDDNRNKADIGTRTKIIRLCLYLNKLAKMADRSNIEAQHLQRRKFGCLMLFVLQVIPPCDVPPLPATWLGIPDARLLKPYL